MISTETHPSEINQGAPLQEIFSSFQGEGPYVGKRQIFVRFAHCHLKCAYCDTPMTSTSGQCETETLPGSNQYHFTPNPVSTETLITLIRDLNTKAQHHSISFTGGEPLLYHRYLEQVLPALQQLLPTYLETSGTQADFLAPVLPYCDIIAMDIKLPSSTQEAPQFDAHQAFYTLAKSRPKTELFIKLIFNQNTTEDELEQVFQIVSDRNTPIILQPETDRQTRQVNVPIEKIFWAENFLSKQFQDVRVIPQTHKMLNVL